MNRYKQCFWNQGKHWILKRKLSKIDKATQHRAVSMAWEKFKIGIGSIKQNGKNIYIFQAYRTMLSNSGDVGLLIICKEYCIT